MKLSREEIVLLIASLNWAQPQMRIEELILSKRLEAKLIEESRQI
jgi:hypothetical protein